MIPFFTLHYGLFCVVHGVFVFVLLGERGVFATSTWDARGQSAVLDASFVITGLALGGSHLLSFFTNFLGKGEFRRTSLLEQMAQPYARVVVLHLAILGGAVAVIALGSPAPLLIALIIAKTALDLSLHLREHRGDQARTRLT